MTVCRGRGGAQFASEWLLSCGEGLHLFSWARKAAQHLFVSRCRLFAAISRVAMCKGNTPCARVKTWACCYGNRANNVVHYSKAPEEKTLALTNTLRGSSLSGHVTLWCSHINKLLVFVGLLKVKDKQQHETALKRHTLMEQQSWDGKCTRVGLVGRVGCCAGVYSIHIKRDKQHSRASPLRYCTCKKKLNLSTCPADMSLLSDYRKRLKKVKKKPFHSCAVEHEVLCSPYSPVLYTVYIISYAGLRQGLRATL